MNIKVAAFTASEKSSNRSKSAFAYKNVSNTLAQHNDINLMNGGGLHEKHAVTIDCFDHMFNDKKFAELALAPCSKLYHLIIYQ